MGDSPRRLGDCRTTLFQLTKGGIHVGYFTSSYSSCRWKYLSNRTHSSFYVSRQLPKLDRFGEQMVDEHQPEDAPPNGQPAHLASPNPVLHSQEPANRRTFLLRVLQFGGRFKFASEF